MHCVYDLGDIFRNGALGTTPHWLEALRAVLNHSLPEDYFSEGAPEPSEDEPDR